MRRIILTMFGVPFIHTAGMYIFSSAHERNTGRTLCPAWVILLPWHCSYQSTFSCLEYMKFARSISSSHLLKGTPIADGLLNPICKRLRPSPNMAPFQDYGKSLSGKQGSTESIT